MMATPVTDALWSAVNRLSQLPLGAESVQATLRTVASSGVTLIAAVHECGVTVLHDGRPSTDAATGGVVYEVDNFQYDVDQGPCLHALLSGDATEISSMAAEQRWPTYASFAAERGLCSSLSLPLTLGHGAPLAAPVVSSPGIAAAVAAGRVGVMNLYSDREAPFSADERWVAEAFATHAAAALANARAFEAAQRLTVELQVALRSRAGIEQAKGILMARHGVSADEAFDLLRQRSQRANRKLRDIAEELVAATATAGSVPAEN
jgi:GAF domain-containing protein